MSLGLHRRELPPAPDLASALRTAAGELGHRPAVTVVRPERREEQGYASLAQWAAKGAHLLEVDYDLGPGDWIGLAGPAGWLPVAVCLAAWWTGAGVRIGGDVEVAVVHEACSVPDGAEVLWFGDAIDGAPQSPVTTGDVYATAVQAFPDQPPPSRAGSDLGALEVSGRRWSQAELLATAATYPGGVTLGVDAFAPADLWVPAAAVHPLQAGRPTVVLVDVDREAAAGERVGEWLA